jgi:tetratricopeptide (TPR) repeat protein
MKLSLTTAHWLAAALAGLALAVTAVATALGWRELPPPFIWLDVAVVYVVAALPLLASTATAALLQMPLRLSSLALVTLETAVLIFIPRLYIHARCQRDLREAGQLAYDSRFGEASALAHRTLDLQPNARFGNNSVAAFAKSMDQIVRGIEQRLEKLLAEATTDTQRIQCADGLAILGKTNEALAMLDSSATITNEPQACILRGTLYENQRQWQVARDWYARGKIAWDARPASAERSVGLAQAIRGIAYCQRKLGHLHAAEAAWQGLLALSPSADRHLLLAQFYEDTQQTAKAQFHAYQAMQLAPAGDFTQHQARQIQNKLLTSHFGCLGIIGDNWLRPNVPIPVEDGTRRSDGEGLTK